VLKHAAIPATVYAAQETNHTRINANLGKPDDPVTQVLFDFVSEALAN